MRYYVLRNISMKYNSSPKPGYLYTYTPFFPTWPELFFGSSKLCSTFFISYSDDPYTVYANLTNKYIILDWGFCGGRLRYRSVNIIRYSSTLNLT